MHSGRVGDLSEEQLAALDSVSKMYFISVYMILNRGLSNLWRHTIHSSRRKSFLNYTYNESYEGYKYYSQEESVGRMMCPVVLKYLDILTVSV